jgi:hypothetical protein
MVRPRGAAGAEKGIKKKWWVREKDNGRQKARGPSRVERRGGGVLRESKRGGFLFGPFNWQRKSTKNASTIPRETHEAEGYAVLYAATRSELKTAGSSHSTYSRCQTQPAWPSPRSLGVDATIGNGYWFIQIFTAPARRLAGQTPFYHAPCISLQAHRLVVPGSRCVPPVKTT